MTQERIQPTRNMSPGAVSPRPYAEMNESFSLTKETSPTVGNALDFMSDFAGLNASDMPADNVRMQSTATAQTMTGAKSEFEPPIPEQVSPSAPAPARTRSRSERFAGNEAPVSKDKGNGVAPTGEPPARGAPSHASMQVVQGLNALKTHGAKTVVDAKRSMAAAKVLTPLVAAISFNPGFEGTQDERTSALSVLLREVHATARATAERVSEVCGRDVPQWMVTQLMQGLAEAAASQWQRTGTLKSGVLANAMGAVFSQSSQLAEVIESASQAAYQEVTSVDQARDRVSVSTVNAAWKIYDWITHPQLAIDGTGVAPSVFFTYGVDPMVLVSKILQRCVDEARGFLLEVSSPDLRVSHLQASIGRMTSLVGAEYVTQTRHIMTWIEEADGADVKQERELLAQAQLETHVLPHVFEWARQNFIRIEEGAVNAVEVFDENNPKTVSGPIGSFARDVGDADQGQH